MGSDSLAVAGLFELLGGGVTSMLAQCADAVFRLGTSTDFTNYTLGVHQPTQDFVTQLAGLDGEQPQGRRSSNRTLTLPVTIFAPDRATLARAREAILAAVNEESWELIWTRDGGLPMVIDCYRAAPVPVYSQVLDKNCISQLTLTVPAAPYGRSDVVQTVSFQSPVSGNSAPASPVSLDDYSTVSGSGWAQSAQAAAGSFSAFHAATAGAATYSKTFSAKDLSAQSSLTLFAGLGAPTVTEWYNWHAGPVQFSFTLTDSAARTTSFGAARRLVASNNPAAPAWAQVTVPLPDDPDFDFVHVTGYELVVHNFSTAFYGELLTTAVYLDALQAIPSAQQVPASIRGYMYNVAGVAGSARTPLNLQVQQPATAMTQVTVLTGAGVWIPPAGVSAVKVECWGAGGAGGSRTTSGLGGGGGGGEYAAEASVALAGSVPIAYSCGAAGTPAGAGGSTVTVPFATGGISQWLCPAGVTSIQAECWGAGAGGGMGSPPEGQPAGGGGGGEYAKETAVAVTPGHTYQVNVGAGGSGAGGNFFAQTSGAGDGGDTSFAGDSLTVLGNGGSAGQATTFGAAGSGSSNTTHHSGGRGGGSNNSAAGGGGGSSGGTSAAGNNGGTASFGGSAGSGGSAVTGGGAGGAGTSSSGSGNGSPGSGPGGGGGAGSGGTSGGQGADGQVIITYTLAATGVAQVNGGTTTFGPVGSTTVTAHGGTSVALNTATGAAGATGSANTTHHNGGAGFTATSGGGGGGAGADSTGAGVAATSSTGATAALDGGSGGSGGGSANTGGSAGLPPGGGGGGADSTGTAEVGGAGGVGQIRVTYTRTLSAFRTLIAHRPGPDAPQALNPLVSFGGVDPPDGRLYPVTSPVPGRNATFKGTYSLWLVGYSFNNPTASRTVTVTVTQTDYQGGPSTTLSKSRTFTPSTDCYGSMICIDEITLPIRLLAGDNSTATFSVSVVSANGSDRFLDLLLVDTQGQCVIIATASGYVNLYLDAPEPGQSIGNILGSAFDRSEAASIINPGMIVGPPLMLYPGDNPLLLYCVEGAPAAYASYYPRWITERTA